MPCGRTPGSKGLKKFNPNRYKKITEFRKEEKPLMCKRTGCSYNFEKDCSEGCMILKYLEEEEGEE